MRKTSKFFCFIFFSCILLFTSSFTVNAQSMTKSYQDINTFAKSFASQTIAWNDISIVSTKKLYDFNNNLIAYSVDIKDNKTNSNGYEILSAINTNSVLEFSKTKSSPYENIEDKYNCIYAGLLNYFYQDKISTKTFFNIKTKSKLSETEINEFKNKQYNLINSYKSLSTNFLSYSNKSQNVTANETEKILEDVPDEPWYLGCAPTGIAMVLEYDFYNDTPEFKQLVKMLATAMGTDSKGRTYAIKEADGVRTVMKNLGVNVWVQLDEPGKNYSTFNKYVNEINNNHPVVVNLEGSKIVTQQGYPNGFGDHACAGIGYKYSNNQQFIVVHTDGMDGDVYCDFNSPLLGINEWLYIH